MKLVNCKVLLPGHVVGEGLDIAVEDGAIVGIREHDARNTTADDLDCTGRLVMPGLINCHGHTAMTLVRGRGTGLPLKRWLEEAIFPVEAKMTPADIYAGAYWGALEMLAGGTVAVADMYDCPDECAAAFAATGIRARVCRVGLSFVPGRLENCIEWTRSFNADGKEKSGVQGDLSIHSEYLTDEPFCRALAAANRELKRPLHVHISETETEHRECIARHGKTPIAYLAETGIFDYGGYAAHCVWCTDDDFRIMAEKGISLVHNPTSNMKLGSGFARVVRARELGVNVALGTDGCASNDNLDMFEEMHLASLIHKGLAHDPTVLPPWEIIDMATVNGAKALGMNDAGEIAVGRRADLIVLDLDRLHLTPCLDIPDLVVHSMHASDVALTIVGGRIVYDRDADEFLPSVDRDAAKNALLQSVSAIGLGQ